MEICELKFPQMELLLPIPPEPNMKIASGCQAMQAVGGGEVDRELGEPAGTNKNSVADQEQPG